MPYAGSTAPDGWLLCNGAEISKTTYAALSSALSFSASITMINNNGNVTTASTGLISVGSAVTGTGIPAGAYVVSITNATTFVISPKPTASGTITASFNLYDRQTNPTTGALYAAPATGNFRLPDYRGLFLRGAGTPFGSKGDGTNGAFETVYLGDLQDQKTGKNGLAVTVNKNLWNTDQNSHSHAIRSQFDDTAGGTYLSDTRIGSDYDQEGVRTQSSTVTWDSANANGVVAGDIETRPINRGVNYIIKI
jgi:uncharacterized protein YwbE